MLLARELVSYISRQIIKKLTPQWIESTDAQVASEFIAGVVEDELAVEDRLNDEVRDLLSQYSEYMRREGVSYQEMFRLRAACIRCTGSRDRALHRSADP